MDNPRRCNCAMERVIVLLDVDSFEVQLRGKNEGIPSHILLTHPFAVKNKNVYVCGTFNFI